MGRINDGEMPSGDRAQNLVSKHNMATTDDFTQPGRTVSDLIGRVNRLEAPRHFRANGMLIRR
jgi:hypothetical protein